MSEDKKELHMQQAGEFRSHLTERQEKIRNPEIREKLDTVIRKLGDLRDLQYWFDSGEKELDRLYERYMPYLVTILDSYIKLENSWNHEELDKVKAKLAGSLQQFADMLGEIMTILPQDEIDEAAAQAKAKKQKEELDRKYRKFYEETN
ncbi:MAG: hypothetical protein IKD69_06835 [Solobacterium sp.]|nr:hypothetical protein [Solobacterium sp.]